jgi:hypothetical protein
MADCFGRSLPQEVVLFYFPHDSIEPCRHGHAQFLSVYSRGYVRGPLKTYQTRTRSFTAYQSFRNRGVRTCRTSAVDTRQTCSHKVVKESVLAAYCFRARMN